MASATIVFDAITVERANTFAFDVWYANHYLPHLMACGVATARRYLSPVRGGYLAVLEPGPGVCFERATRPGHDLIASHERLLADSIGARSAAGAGERASEADLLYPVFFRVPAAREREFNAWYEEEHMEMLLDCEYWRMCRRFRIRAAGESGFTHVALHYLTDLRALESPQRDRARSTTWRDRLAAEPWFKGEYRVYFRWGGRLEPASQRD